MAEGMVEREVAIESDDRLLLREFAHRTANDYAAALAAMRLSIAGKGPRSREGLIEEAIARLEASSAVHLLLAAPARREVDAGALVDEVCRAVAGARPTASGGCLRRDVAKVVVAGEIARRLGLVAAELVANAVKHAFRERAGELTVRVDRIGGAVRLIVADDGPGMRPGPASGTGWGRGIVAELVARAAGSLSVDSSPSGTVVEVLLPVGADGAEVQHVF